MSLASGVRLGPYEILSAIGAGGMGEVYRARDTRLNRDVAIKVMPPDLAADPERRRRFEQEARAVAALNHPHICQIYDIGPDYLVLELVDGRQLEGPSSAPDAVRLALQITDALQAAHARGILHRDLKPSNVVVTSDGKSKLLDFGIAKLAARDSCAEQTIDGAVIGTAAYMSPEQAQGRALDARSDIFSFGALLYELISGRRAFPGSTDAEAFSAVLRDEPPPLHAPAPLERVVRKCLQKDPAQRFQTASALKAALEPLAATEPNPPRSIAVLPFENMSGDKENEYFSDGLAEEIINSLAQIPGLKVIARTSAFAFKGRHEDIRRIAEALGVTTVLEGSVRKAGTRLRVTAQLITAADGSHLWSERYDRELTDVFAIQDEIAASIAAALEVTLGTVTPRARYTPKLPAYEALLRARHFILSHAVMSQSSAHVWLERAMKLDPGYAEPHASLGLSYFLLNMMGARSHDTMPLIRAEANHALRLDPLDPSPRYLLGAVAAAFEHDWDQALEHFTVATAGTAPAEAHWAYASLYLQPRGKFADAVAQMQRAVERDPLNAMWRGVLASHLTHAERYEQAIAEATRARQIDPTHIAPPHDARGGVCHSWTLVGGDRCARDGISYCARFRAIDGLARGRAAARGADRTRCGDRRRARDCPTAADGNGAVSRAMRGDRCSGRLVRALDRAARSVRPRVRRGSAGTRAATVAALGTHRDHDELAVARVKPS